MCPSSVTEMKHKARQQFCISAASQSLPASGITGILCYAATLMIYLLEFVCAITIINVTNKITVPKHKFNITEPTHEHCSNETSLNVWLPHESAKGMQIQARQ
jgi:hypothetical protein